MMPRIRLVVVAAGALGIGIGLGHGASRLATPPPEYEEHTSRGCLAVTLMVGDLQGMWIPEPAVREAFDVIQEHHPDWPAEVEGCDFHFTKRTIAREAQEW